MTADVVSTAPCPGRVDFVGPLDRPRIPPPESSAEAAITGAVRVADTATDGAPRIALERVGGATGGMEGTALLLAGIVTGAGTVGGGGVRFDVLVERIRSSKTSLLFLCLGS